MAERETEFTQARGVTKICCNPPVYVNISSDEFRRMVQDAVRAELKSLMMAERRSLLARADAIKRDYE